MRLFVAIIVVNCNFCTSCQRKSATKKTSKSPLAVRKRAFKSVVFSRCNSKESVKAKPKTPTRQSSSPKKSCRTPYCKTSEKMIWLLVVTRAMKSAKMRASLTEIVRLESKISPTKSSKTPKKRNGDEVWHIDKFVVC